MDYRISIVLMFCLSSFFCAFANASKTILVTAATSGLGEAICNKLAQNGNYLILSGRSPDKLKVLKENLEQKFKGTYEVALFDYTNIQSIQDLAAKIKGPIDGMVLIPPRSSLPTKNIPSPKEWQETLNMCFIAPLEFIRLLAPKLNPESSIVVISGLTSVYYMPQYPNINVPRLMWTGEIKNLVNELSLQKIRVNALSPGVILTPHNIQKIQQRAQIEGRSYEEQLAMEAKDTPLNRYGQPEDVANSVNFLLSKDSKHVSGTNMILDGGLSHSY